MYDTLAATLPVVLLIAIGYGLKRSAFLDDGFWRPAALSPDQVAAFAMLVAVVVHLGNAVSVAALIRYGGRGGVEVLRLLG